MLFVLSILFVASCVAQMRHGRLPKSNQFGTKLPYTTTWFTQRMDHFNYQTPNGGRSTFEQRVLYNLDYWKSSNASQCPGPIFFYTGNESPVTDYWDNSGFVIDVLAKDMGAAVYFVEHRYFGESMPYGNDSFKGSNIGYLSPEQALADYAYFLTSIKDAMPYDCPVFSFGGSYGGMLTAWFRVKYPWVIMGGLAASAPVAFHDTNLYNPYAFEDSCQDTYADADSKCPSYIESGLKMMAQLGGTASGRATISRTFKLCKPLQSADDVTALSEYFQGALVDMSMLDYPYKSNYGVVFPAWPVNTTCADIAKYAQHDVLKGLSAGLENFYNASGTRPCLDTTKDVPDWGSGDGWPYLACTELYFPMAQRGMWYPHTTPDIPAYVHQCEKQFGVTTRVNWAATQFGGVDFSAASNIIFSNGLLDPWHSSGILTSQSPSLPAIVIPEAAHHLDLRGPHPNDPIYVQKARLEETHYIKKWIKEWFQNNLHKTIAQPMSATFSLENVKGLSMSKRTQK